MAHFKSGRLIERTLSVVSAAGTTVLVNSTQQNIRVTGTMIQTIQLPDATTCPNGTIFVVSNSSTSAVTVTYNDTTTLSAITSNTDKTFVLFDNSTSNGVWVVRAGGSGSGSSSITVTAGEALAVRDAVYISIADGFAYKSKAGNVADGWQFVGFTTAAIAASATGTVQVGGELTGFSALTAGEIYYLDPTTNGAIVALEPTLDAGSFSEFFYRVPVGRASTTTAIVINSEVISQKQVQFVGRNLKGINQITNSVPVFNTQGWVTYKDAAGSIPVDGTGGSPSLTLTQDLSYRFRAPENNFFITKPASNVQGEGVSTNFIIDPSDANRPMEISFDYVPDSVYVGGTNSDIRVFVYKVVGTDELIYPSDISVSGGAGGVNTYKATFQSREAGQYRLILHWANTSATAVNFYFSEVVMGPQQIASGPSMSDEIITTTTIKGSTSDPTKGTIDVDILAYRRVGDSLECRVQYHQTGGGSDGSGNYYFPLPGNLLIDTSKLDASTPTAAHANVGNCEIYDSANYWEGHVAVWDTTAVHIVALKSGSALAALDTIVNFANDIYFCFVFRVPIAGWSANVAAASSTVFRIADTLQNGTRVTGAAPAALGEWRSQLRNAAALTFTDTNGDPTTFPTSADGIKLYNGNAFASSDTSNEPTWYEIFVGKNKTIRWDFYASTGRTGEVDISQIPFSTLTAAGYRRGYDPTAGVAWISPFYASTAETAHHSGADQSAFVDDIYFDIIVSENALQVQIEPLTSEIIARTDSGFGSTNTAIRRFASATTTGQDLVYASSATLGDTFTINADGIYSTTFNDNFSSTTNMGISLNSSQLTTGISSITNTDVVSIDGAEGTDRPAIASGVLHLRRGDIIRAHCETSLTAGSVTTAQSFRIVRVA